MSLGDHNRRDLFWSDTAMRVRARFWFEALLAALTSSVFVLTIVSRNWIEAVFAIDPDRSSGSFEWTLVGLLFVASGVLVMLARAEWQRPRSPAN